MANVREIEGIGDASATKLEAAGVKTEEQLLAAGRTEKMRDELAAKTGITETNIHKWVKMADMNRVKGIGPQTSELLLACGVDTVNELAQRNAENLHAKMEEVNKVKNLTNGMPSVGQLQKFIDEAKSLPRMVEA